MGKSQERARSLVKRRTHAITGEGKHYYRVFKDLQRPGVLIFQCACGGQQAIRQSLMARLVKGQVGMMESGFIYIKVNSKRKSTL